MNIQDWAMVSDRAIMFASVVFALSFVSYIVEWAISRTLVPAETQVLVGSGEPVEAATQEPSDKELRADMFGRIGVSLLVLGTVLQGVGLMARGLATDPIRVPWGNMYEFTLAGTFGVSLIYLLLMRRYDLRWLGTVVSGFLVVVLMLDQSVLYKDAGPVMPALHSYWLVIHVLAAIIATGAFAVAAMLSALYLIKDWATRRGSLRPRGFLAQLPALDTLDRVAYRLNAIGFPIWTFAALVAGPIWAKYAWGSYWNWDPKEVWAFITWVGYACYLHARATAGFKGRVVAIIALVAFATLVFNFVGINFFFGGGSAHSYAK